jgi:hypothetical protein
MPTACTTRMGTLRHVLWIGGGPGAGKSTVAGRIRRRHGLRGYGADTRTWRHRDRAIRLGNPAARRWEAMTSRERWELSTPGEMLAMSLHGERGEMVIDDLRALPAAPLVIAEGTTLPAHAVTSGVAERSRAVWLLPTPAFQRASLAARGLPPGPTALYLLLGETIEREAAAHGVRTVRVDGTRSIGETVVLVEELLGDALAEGSCARSRAERVALLREANDALATQVRDYHARAWSRGDPEAVVLGFDCECGDDACDAVVDVPVGVQSSRAVLAPGHH